eukprot:5448232-Amphidinium_carterae.1
MTFEDFQGNQEADVVANLGAAAHDAHEPSADSFGFWFDRNSETDLRPGRAPGCLRRPRLTRLPRFCRWSRALRPFVWKDHTDVSSFTTRLPAAWTGMMLLSTK